ncbi:regulator of G-protein signaling 5a isoform X3 [Chanos chanos]|uniref:Regulator of G-protein signaling 5 n=1 Tax=Chanos chanos TaxID=29144 RepID=A0A6J2WS37_CHACN|nr:regulator of G-protein signaling 5-like isoform X3 [Chanos chanos]
MCKGLAALPQTCLERAKEIKTKLGTLLQKPDWSICSWKCNQNRPTPEEAAQWRESLDRVLNNSYGLVTFKSFLRSEFSQENIEFWEACEEFKKTKSPLKMAAKAKKIYEDFIQTGGPKEVNIDHFTKDVTLRNLVDLSPSTFDLAQSRIYTLMEKDSFGRFLRSEHYQELLK